MVPPQGPAFASLQRRFYWYCLWPALVVMIVITLLPTVYLVATSFTPLDLTRPETQWNFATRFLQYELLHRGPEASQLALGAGQALVLDGRASRCSRIPLRAPPQHAAGLLEALRTVFFLIPMVLPPIVVAIIWKVLYTPDISPFHWFMEWLGLPVASLITNPDTALMAIVIADIWEWFPFCMLMILAALQMMPERVRGRGPHRRATPLQITWFITLPYLKGVLMVAGLFRLIDSIKAFPLIFILTDGGPGTVTEVTNFYSYIQAFNFSISRLLERDHGAASSASPWCSRGR